MILTVTPNSALDRVIFIDELQAGEVMRSPQMIASVGGKGLDVSVVLRTFCVETRGLLFAAGATGQELIRLLDGYGILHDVVWVEGETRTAHVLVEKFHHRHSHVTAGELRVSPDACREFLRRYQMHLDGSAWVIAAGSLPASLPVAFYGTLTRMARNADVPVLVDAYGPAIQNALEAHPTIAKMNRSEFTETFGVPKCSMSELSKQAGAICERYQLAAFVITCGEDGILALAEDQVYKTISPRQAEVNAAGAGDAVSAALVWRLSLGDGWDSALAWAAAASSAAVLTEGTADCRMDDIRRILPQVKVTLL